MNDGWSIRREMLDHVIPLNERHLMRLSYGYVSYYHEDRTHIGLDKETRELHSKCDPAQIQF